MAGEPQFKVSDWQGKKTLRIDSERIDECMSYYRQHQLDGIAISPLTAYKRADIEFIREHPYLTGLILSDTENIDISPIEVLTDLSYVSISGNQQPIDFSQFRKLQSIRVEWHPKMVITARCSALRHLYLRRYKPKSKNLTALPELPDLEELEIVVSPLLSIEGVERFPGLRQLLLAHLTKLERVSAIATLANGRLDILDCNTCRKIQDHDAVRHLASLRILRFNNCGEIPNIRFLKEMPSLEDFRFVDTNVVDGDLTPCLGLKSVGFFAKKHYSHTPEEMDALLGK